MTDRRTASHLKNFKWPYFHNPLHVWF